MLRVASVRSKPKPPLQHITKRFRKQGGAPRRGPRASNNGKVGHKPVFAFPQANTERWGPEKNMLLQQCIAYFQLAVRKWLEDQHTILRFEKFGYDKIELKPFLEAFADKAQSGFFTSSEEMLDRYQITRLVDASKSLETAHQRLGEAEVMFSNIFFSWIANPRDSAQLDELVAKGIAEEKVLRSLRHIAEVSIRRPAEDYPWARQMHRKFIMHVGPTNSGKTYHALRALAAAKTGVYAGPLRLLAHEIWERLNLGQIVPLGVDVENPSPLPTPSLPSSSSESKSTTTSVPDTKIAPQAVKLNYNPAYARLTNMVTGEEKKVVHDNAPLLSCTVEMINLRAQYDVGVIDEIQMIGDPERGSAWTQAVLGMCAHEIHLCGEESAIPVVQQLVDDTGDELVIRRYERLTPLSVEEKSLEGDYGKVQKGDCVVAFSRSRIFEIKEEIEKKRGLRCAVVYGKLPPEVRSEQAALFNDPDSGFDVIVGSDAIGMGLNLRIRRIIFDATSKSSGGKFVQPLSISQVKQIAGRAGRYGHSLAGEQPGGFATTLNPNDLESLKTALDYPATPTLPHAYISPNLTTFMTIASALPSTPSTSSIPSTPSTPSSPRMQSTLETALMAHIYASLPPRAYKYAHPPKLSDTCTWVERQSQGVFTWEDKLTLLYCPIPWRDVNVTDAAALMTKMQRDQMSVRIDNFFRLRHGFVEALSRLERLMEWSEPLTKAQAQAAAARKAGGGEEEEKRVEFICKKLGKVREVDTELLNQLESLHKVLVVYMWMHFKNSVVYPDREEAEELKHRVEVGLDWGLQQLGRRTKEGKWVRELREKKAVKKAEENQDEGSVMRAIREIHLERSKGTEASLPRLAPRPVRLPTIEHSNDQHGPTSPSRRRSSAGVDYATEKLKPMGLWDRAPDLTAILQSYVASPNLKVDVKKQAMRV